MTIARHRYNTPQIAAPAGHVELPTLYWSERVGDWWPGVPTRCTVTCRGVLSADPPNAVTVGPGRVACTICPRVVAWVATQRAVRGPFDGEDAKPRRGRRPGHRPRRNYPTHPCAECSEPVSRPEARRCYPCAIEKIRQDGLFGRLEPLLQSPTPLPTRSLAAMLGTTPTVIRGVVKRARRRGVSIVLVKRRYRLLEVAS